MCQRGSRRKERKMNKKAYYGQFGGQYVAESLMNTLQELDQAYEEAIHDPEFMKQYHYYLKQYVGRETPQISNPDLITNFDLSEIASIQSA